MKVTTGRRREVSGPYPALARAVRQALDRHAKQPDPLARAAELGKLLEAIQEQVLPVAEARDAALLELLRAEPRPSNRALAQLLGISPQRVAQLAALARRGRAARR